MVLTVYGYGEMNGVESCCLRKHQIGEGIAYNCLMDREKEEDSETVKETREICIIRLASFC